MTLVVVIQVVIVNVCVQLLLLIQEHVTDMVFISSGGHKNFVVSQKLLYTEGFNQWRSHGGTG
jgi:preprotein translocase subunit SecG